MHNERGSMAVLKWQSFVAGGVGGSGLPGFGDVQSGGVIIALIK